MRRKGFIGAGAVAGAAAVASAVALAATGPGVPETMEVPGGFAMGTLISQAERTCTGTDGDYTERLVHYQVAAANTMSTDPRLDGAMDVYLHELNLTAPTDELPVGHVDGTAHWYASDGGPKTAWARVTGIWREGLIDATVGGAGRTDGYVLPSGDLPRADMYGALSLNETVPGQLQGQFARGKQAVFDTKGVVLQSYNCSGKYEPTDVGSMPLSEMSADRSTRQIRLMRRASVRTLTPRQARGQRMTVRIPATAKPLSPGLLRDLISRG